MSLTLITAPTASAVTLTEAKAHMRVDISDDDTIIQDMIEAAEKLAMTMINRQIMTATYDYKIDQWANVIPLPRAPLQSVTSVKYIDLDKVEQTASSALYSVDTDSVPGRIILDPDSTWPSHRDQLQAITIRYVCGYADSGASPEVPNDTVPEVIKRWMLLQISNMYENREEWVIGTIQTRMTFADRLVMSLKVPDFA